MKNIHPKIVASIVSEIISSSTSRTNIKEEKLIKMISKHYNDHKYIVLADPSYVYTRKQIVDYILGNKIKEPLKDLLHIFEEFGLQYNISDPYDRARLILDSIMYSCLYGARYYPYEVLEDVKIKIKKKCNKKDVYIPYKCLCTSLRKLHTLFLTMNKFYYIFEILDLVDSINSCCGFIPAKSIEDFIEKYIEEDPRVEEFRRYITIYVFPSFKILFLLLNLAKYEFSLTEIVGKRLVKSKGVWARKDISLTYLGRITSELINSMMYGYWSNDVLKAYDTLTNMYFNIFKELAKSIDSGDEYDYIELHPAFDSYYETINNVIKTTEPFVSQYFSKRGLIRTGEVLRDAITYLSSIYYYVNNFDDMFNAPKNILQYNMIELLVNEKLKRK